MSFAYITKNSIGVPEVAWSETEVPPMLPPSFVEWLEPLLTKEMFVYEFGSGQSTFFFARRVRHVSSVEHHRLFYQAMLQALGLTTTPEQASIDLFTQDRCRQCYIDSIGSGRVKHFDIVLVDGISREECLERSIRFVKPDGIIVFDNSELEGHSSIWKMMEDAGFSHRSWTGLYAWAEPGMSAHQTTVFFRPSNKFGLIAST